MYLIPLNYLPLHTSFHAFHQFPSQQFTCSVHLCWTLLLATSLLPKTFPSWESTLLLSFFLLCLSTLLVTWLCAAPLGINLFWGIPCSHQADCKWFNRMVSEPPWYWKHKRFKGKVNFKTIKFVWMVLLFLWTSFPLARGKIIHKLLPMVMLKALSEKASVKYIQLWHVISAK